jgi:ABC-type transporter Mla subunit MlaD
MTSAIEIARQEWEEANRRLEAAADDRGRYRRLLEQVEALTDELRRRVGQTFTLAQLADEYGRADEWARDVLLDEEPPSGAVATVALAQGAAFHLYARGAVDYSP